MKPRGRRIAAWNWSTRRDDPRVRSASSCWSAALLALAGCALRRPRRIRCRSSSTISIRAWRASSAWSPTKPAAIWPTRWGRCAADLRAMHNDIDELNHSLESSRKQQRDLYADLDQRLKALEARGGAARCAAPGRRGGAAQALRRPERATRGCRGGGGPRRRDRRQGRLPGGLRSAEGRPVRSRHRRVSASSSSTYPTARWPTTRSIGWARPTT